MNSTTVRRKNTHPIVTLVASLSISVVFTLAASVVLLSSSGEFVRLRDFGFLRLAYKYLDGPIGYLDDALPALVSRHYYLPDPANILPLSAWAAVWNLPLVWLAAIIVSPLVWILFRRLPPVRERPKLDLFWRRIYPLACFLAIPSLIVITWFDYGILKRLAEGKLPTMNETLALMALPGLWLLALWVRRVFSGFRHFLTLGAALALGIIAAGLALDAARSPVTGGSVPPVAGIDARPNVLLVSIDTLRRDHLSCYGYERETSPNIDSLADEGVLFQTVVAPSAWTLPVHTTLLTALPPTQHDVITPYRRLKPDVVTLPTVLRDAGYATAAFVSTTLLNVAFGLWPGFDHYDDYTHMHAGYTDRCRVSTPALVDAVKDWLEAWRLRGSGRPFFVFLHLYDVHSKRYHRQPGAALYCSPTPFQDMYDPSYTGENKGQWLIGKHSSTERMSERDSIHNMALYDGEIRFVDDQLENLFAILRGLGVMDRTIISVVSDHGEEFYEHGRQGHHQSLYDETILVPWVMRFPEKIPAGRVVDAQVRIMDIAPTILSLAGIPPAPGFGVLKGNRHFAGADLAPLISSRNTDSSALPAFADLEGKLAAIRTAEWKYIMCLHAEGAEELYSLADDPKELINLAEEKPQVRDLLRDELLRWRESGGSAPQSREGTNLTEEERKLLKSLGYLQ